MTTRPPAEVWVPCRVCGIAVPEDEDVCGPSCEAMLDEELPTPGVLVAADESEPAPSSLRIVIVPEPGDRCGGTRVLADGARCPGCRACS